MKKIIKYIKKLFSDYNKSHFEDIDLNTKKGVKKLSLKSFFRWANSTTKF